MIAASVRDHRWAAPARNGLGCLRATAAPRIEAELIDCVEAELPFDELLRPGSSAGSPVSARLAAAAFVFVTPEYNHSYPAGLKRLIEWHYREWMFKPATVLSYGVHGCLLAAEYLRGVLAELYVATTHRVVGLPLPWSDLIPAGYNAPADVTEASTGPSTNSPGGPSCCVRPEPSGATPDAGPVAPLGRRR